MRAMQLVLKMASTPTSKPSKAETQLSAAEAANSSSRTKATRTLTTTMRWKSTPKNSSMRAQNPNDEVSVAIEDPPEAAAEAALVSVAEEEILAGVEEISVAVEEVPRAQDSVATLEIAAALAIVAAEAVRLVVDVGPLAIAGVVAMVVSTRDVLHPRAKAREMRIAIGLAELKRALLLLCD